jgi:putative FmdB family regulatory protein
VPIYEYRCGEGHVTEKLRKYDARDEPAICPQCNSATQRIPSAHHAEVDGIYSHTPNIGTKDAFERKRYGIKENR